MKLYRINTDKDTRGHVNTDPGGMEPLETHGYVMVSEGEVQSDGSLILKSLASGSISYWDKTAVPQGWLIEIKEENT